MINRFNGSKALYKKLTNDEIVSKILGSLSESWTKLKTVIEIIKTTQKNTLDELYGVSMTHELSIMKTNDKTSKSKDKMEEKPKINCLKFYRRRRI